MKKQQVYILFGCMMLGLIVLYGMYALSPFAADIRRESFVRNFEGYVSVRPGADLDLKFNSFYIAGTARNTVYLGSYSGPLHLLQVALPTLDTVHMNLSLDTVSIRDDYRVFRMKVDSPYFYLSHGTMPGIYKGSIESKVAKSFSPNGAPYFSDAVPVSNNRFALKSLSNESKADELAALTLDSPYFEFKPEILEKQIDGIFCVDGNLLYDREINRLVYVYAYRNEYMVLDTSLSQINRFHTIDSFRRAPIKVAEVSSKNYRTLARPPVRINAKSCVSSNLLFVQSPLLAKNEDKLEFQKGCTIDVYNVEQGKYLYSFHLANKYDVLPSSFAVTGDKLIAVFDRHLIVYDLALPGVRQQRTIASQHHQRSFEN